jgi:hypothetical protein
MEEDSDAMCLTKQQWHAISFYVFVLNTLIIIGVFKVTCGLSENVICSTPMLRTIRTHPGAFEKMKSK